MRRSIQSHARLFEVPLRPEKSTLLTSLERSRTAAPVHMKGSDLFPVDLIQGSPLVNIPQIVKRANLWMDTHAAEEVGRFERFPREDLMQLVPEGLAGELPRDLILFPSRTRDVGIMLRKLTLECMLELEDLEEHHDPCGTPTIPKAGFFLDGKRGVGKSSVLTHLVLWARQRNWLVIFEPMPSRYAREIGEIT
jgi:small subunit ribosomal protein S29